MSDWGNRFRFKVIPAEKSGPLEIAHWEYFYEDKWQGHPFDLNRYSPVLKSPGLSYISAKSCRDDVHPGPPWRSGGPFTTVELRSPQEAQVQAAGVYTHPTEPYWVPPMGMMMTRYVGGFAPPLLINVDAGQATFGNVSGSLAVGSKLIPDLSAWGPDAWAKTAPRIEMASGFVALAESRDLPRMMKTTSNGFHDIWKTMGGSPVSKIMQPKKIADTFLNHQFGWLPFISDMRKFYNAFQNTAGYMQRMSAGNDKWKVYRRTLFNEQTKVQIGSGTGMQVQPAGHYFEGHLTGGKPCTWEVWQEDSKLTTSSGAFKWYRPEFDAINSNASHPWDDIANQMVMYGARISPSNVWRATPWSWLIDWGFNVGRNIDRITEFIQDGVVSKYLYVMDHWVRSYLYKQTLPLISGDVVLEFRRIIEIKQRMPAGSPFGFSSPWDDLSPMRLAILGALGISRHAP